MKNKITMNPNKRDSGAENKNKCKKNVKQADARRFASASKTHMTVVFRAPFDARNRLLQPTKPAATPWIRSSTRQLASEKHDDSTPGSSTQLERL